MKIKDDYHVECSHISEDVLRAQNTTGNIVKSVYNDLSIRKVHTTFSVLYEMSVAEYIKR